MKPFIVTKKMICLLALTYAIISCKSEGTEPEPENVVIKLSYIDKTCKSCKYAIKPTEYQFDGDKHPEVKPGDTVGITGDNEIRRIGLDILNVHGEAGKPIVFINCDGKAQLGQDINKGKGVFFKNSSYFKLAGTGKTGAGNEYGINVLAFMGVEVALRSTNFEIYAVEVKGAGYAGIACRSDAACDGSIALSNFTQYETILHDNYVHDTGGEGFYVGGSHWGAGQTFQPGCEGTRIWEPELKGVEIYNNRVIHTGRDGIQVGSAVERCNIYNNYIEDFSYKKEEGNQSGFQINPGTTGKLYNNIINGGNGFGIFMIGRGENLVFNNLIINPSYDGIQVGDRTPSKDAAFGFKFLNNTIINPKSKGYVSYTKETKGNEFINNIIVAPSGIYFDNKSNFIESNNILVKDITELMFASPGSLDYSLLEGSPAIDKGKDVSLSGIIDDILGKKRDVNVNPYDIGAYEFQKKR